MSSATHTVLVVDDEPGVLAALRRTLRDPAYRVVTASNARQALDLLADGGIDILVSDIDMPGMSGIELVKEVRSRHPDVIRLLLTGDASLDSALSAINDGEVFRYLVKPWSAQELRRTLMDAVARLSELRAAARASARQSARERMLLELEAEHPGIRAVSLDDGVYRLDTAALDAAASRLPGQLVAAFVAPADRDANEEDQEAMER